MVGVATEPELVVEPRVEVAVGEWEYRVGVVTELVVVEVQV